jgi:hypothetical protein
LVVEPAFMLCYRSFSRTRHELKLCFRIPLVTRYIYCPRFSRLLNKGFGLY